MGKEYEGGEYGVSELKYTPLKVKRGNKFRHKVP